MKNFFCGSLVFLFLLVGQAQASFPCCDPTECWTGCYVGVHGGYGWAHGSTLSEPVLTPFGDAGTSNFTFDPDGGFGGLQVGYNYQFDRAVVGVETDFSGAGIGKTAKISPVPLEDGTFVPGEVRTRHQIAWFGTLRLRAGYTFFKSLIYGTGGLVYGDIKYSAAVDFGPGNAVFPVSFDHVRATWTAGGGIEYAFCSNWSLKIEYLYFNLRPKRSKTTGPIQPNPPFQQRFTFDNEDVNLVRLGLNYRFR